MRQENTVRILIADDFAEWRARVRSFLRAHPNWQVISEACDGVEAVEKAAELLPDIVILDIGMPRMNGIEAAKIIRRRSPGSKIMFLTGIGDADFGNATLSATGAVGYVLKTKATSELQRAVEAALQVVILPSPFPTETENLPS
jgi:DNA-binding NarL/FixJ family response regulator